jgi:hypothetical protein
MVRHHYATAQPNRLDSNAVAVNAVAMISCAEAGYIDLTGKADGRLFAAVRPEGRALIVSDATHALVSPNRLLAIWVPDAHFLVYEKTNSKSVLCSADDDDAAYDGVLETVTRRAAMIARGTCTAAEYQRMAAEKVAAMQISIAALMRGRGQAAMLAPFVNRARANARRLRHKS